MSEIVSKGDRVTISPGKDVVASMANAFKTELAAVIGEKPAVLTIDLSNVEMIDSIGIGIVIATHNSLQKIGGVLEVSNASADIYNIFVTMRLNHHFGISMAREA